MDALEETAEFMQTVASFFTKANSVRIKHAYAELLISLLLPLASVTGAEVNVPVWTQAVDAIYPKAYKMTMKPRHMPISHLLSTAVLSVSKREFFLQNFFPFIDVCWQKMKVPFMLSFVSNIYSIHCTG